MRPAVTVMDRASRDGHAGERLVQWLERQFRGDDPAAPIDRQQAIDPLCMASMFDSLEVEVLYPA
jgi:hypothetical protein